MRRLLFAACTIASFGCSLLTPLGDLTSGTGDSGAAVVDDASPDAEGDASANAGADANADADAAIPNIHPNGTFESGCSTWTAFQGTSQPSNIAHSGSGACRFCGKAGLSVFTADDSGQIPGPPIGSELRVEAWVRAAPGAAAPTDMSLVLRMRNDDPFEEVQKQVDLFPAPTDTWTPLVATFTVAKTAQSFNVVVGADAVPNSCFLLDDVTVVRTK